MRLTHRCASIALLGGVLTLGIVWCQWYWRVLHPHPLILGVPFFVMVVAAIVCLATGLWRVVRGPRRLLALFWSSTALLPLLCWTALGLYALTRFRDRQVPGNLPMDLAKIAAASLLRAEVAVRYPRREETERLIMCYATLEHPRSDAEAMDRHLARMEALLGGNLRAKVLWVRGPSLLIGTGPPDVSIAGISFCGIAFGSGRSPRDWDAGGGLDRHELAHAVLDEYRARDSDPPYLLHEGWADSQTGLDVQALARNAHDFRRRNPSVRLRDLVGPDQYHFVMNPASYELGGAFVDFLIRRYGVSRFLRLYKEGRQATFDAACRHIFGSDLDALEADFWGDVRRQIEGIPAQPIGSRWATMKRLIVFRVGKRWFAKAIEVRQSESGSLYQTSWVSIPHIETAMRGRSE